MRPLRVGLCGVAGAGKDTAGAYLVSLGLKRISIATPIKQVALATVEGFLEGLEGRVDPSIIATLRSLTSQKSVMRKPYQQAGAAGRDADVELWTSSMVRMNDLEDEHQGQGFVCTDIRHPDEAAILKRLGFTIIRIAAEPSICAARLAARDGFYDPSITGHVSETNIVNIHHDILLENNTEEDRERMYRALDGLLTPEPPDHYNQV